MSTMAKIFVVVNLVLGVAVFGSAATLLGAQDDYKQAFQKATDKAEETIETLRRQNENLTKREAEAAQKASEATGRARTAEGDLEASKTTNATLKAANEKLNASVETYAQEISALREVIEKDRAARELAVKNATQATQDKINFQKRFEEEARARAQHEQTISDQQEQIQELAAQKGDLAKKIRELEFELSRFREMYGDVVGKGKGSDGVVSAVKGNLVTISVGTEDGVRRGDTYHIRRGSDYVGQIRITRVNKGLSVGEFDTQFTGPGGSPQVGDVAYVR